MEGVGGLGILGILGILGALGISNHIYQLSIINYQLSISGAPFVWITNPDAFVIRICNPIKQKNVLSGL